MKEWCWNTRGSGNATELEAAFRKGSILHPNQRIILKRKKRLISKSVGRMDENVCVWDSTDSSDADGDGVDPDICVIPKLNTESIPEVGKEFDSLQDVYNFYNNYAEKAGFSIRSHSSKKDRLTREIKRKEYVCSKQGTYCRPEAEGRVRKRRRVKVRQDCKARIGVVKCHESNKYSISLFEEVHNHSLTTPDKVHLLRSHRDVRESRKALKIDQLGVVNTPTHQPVSNLEVQAGGMENIGCINKDFYDWETNMRTQLLEHDVELLSEHFGAEKRKSESFYFKMEADSSGKLTNLFWADSTSRRAYKFYGDVIVFDTTYNTNRYGLNAMPGPPPKMIITDHDAAMTKAIVNPPTLRDRFSYLNACMWDIDTTIEFESKWLTLITENGLNDHPWLSSIYDLRDKWVPAYAKHVFSAGMLSSKQPESSHAFFKPYVSRKNSLMDFVVRFERGLAKQRHEELYADHVDRNEKPASLLETSMETQVAGLYTKALYQKFQKEELKSLKCFLQCTTSDDRQRVYKVTERIKPGVSKVKEVVYDASADLASCSCKHLESCGIPCRHVLAFLKHEQVEYLPDKYLLQRWMQKAKSALVFDRDAIKIKDHVDRCVLVRRSTLSKRAITLIDSASMSEEAGKVLLETLQGVQEKIESMGQEIGHAQGSGKAVASDSQTVTLMDPLRVRVKGKEKAMDQLKRWCTEFSLPGNNDDTTQSMPNTQSSPIVSLMDEFDIYASASSHPVCSIVRVCIRTG
ncbi:hypothetical protein Prudu_012830 [Prunus dulcis]|uniref:SWIM-type domain-containing protein n=1 Tax=Prunus dulcis TaxID=3755 RepID=A0A4Y1RE20_PRUDU|nr:hypothetical protein Prudu_012830 [Prunus dulcis]